MGETRKKYLLLNHKIVSACSRKVAENLSPTSDMSPLLSIITHLLKVPAIGAAKGVLDPMAKILSHTIKHCPFTLQQLTELTSLCYKAYSKVGSDDALIDGKN